MSTIKRGLQMVERQKFKG